MVSILPNQRSPWDVIGSAIGSNIGQSFPGAVQQGLNRGMLQQNLGQIKNIASNPQGTNLDVLLSLLQAGAGIPGSEKYISAIAPELLKMVESNRASGSTLPGEQGQQPQPQMQRNREPIESHQPIQQLPEFGGNRFFPTNLGPGEGPGHIPQEATTGQKLPLLSPNEKPAAIKKLIADNKAAGRVLTIPEAKAEIDAYEEDKKKHNAQVDAELKQQVEAQKTYGQRAVEYLKEFEPSAGAEIQTIFQKKGEQLASQGKSEADINRSLAKEAEKYRAAITNVESDLSAPRFLHKITRGLNGTYKNFDQSAEDLRKHLAPLMDLGLYNKARTLLQKKGYGPEEREMILHPLTDQSLSYIKQAPNLQPQARVGYRGITSPKPDINTIKETLKQVKQADPNFSPLLARKAFEDLNYDWRSFKDAWNELLNEGFELSGDQKQMQGYLDTPPVNLLDKFLSGLNLIGR